MSMTTYRDEGWGTNGKFYKRRVYAMVELFKPNIQEEHPTIDYSKFGNHTTEGFIVMEGWLLWIPPNKGCCYDISRQFRWFCLCRVGSESLSQSLELSRLNWECIINWPFKRPDGPLINSFFLFWMVFFRTCILWGCCSPAFQSLFCIDHPLVWSLLGLMGGCILLDCDWTGYA